MNSPERVYALLIEANPIPDPRSVPPVLSRAEERRGVMLTRQPTETKQVTAKPRWGRALAAFAATVVVIGVAVVAWVIASGDGPVAAADAQVEVTFTGEGTSYLGHREIIEGVADVTFINETTSAYLVIHRYDTGSDALADELAFVEEGGNALPGDRDATSYVEFLSTFGQGRHPVVLVLRPGTYIIDTAPDREPTHVYRAAVIEVVSD